MPKVAPNWKARALDFGFFLVGSILFALSVDLFTAPSQIVQGGVTGIATMLHSLFALPIGTVALLLNIPLFIWGALAAGKKFVFKTIIASILTSIMIDLCAPLSVYFTQQDIHQDMMLSSLYGGILAGLGLGLIYIRGATTGGSDLAASLLARKMPHVSFGRFVLLIDFIIAGTSAIVYRNFANAMYSVIVIFLASKTIDMVVYGTGGGNGKFLFIISRESERITKAIQTEVGRGVTLLKGRGGYTGKETDIIMCAVRRQELYRIRTIVRQIDEKSFVISGEAAEVWGQGFLEHLPEEEHKKQHRKGDSGT